MEDRNNYFYALKGKTSYTKKSFRLYLPPTVGYNYPMLLSLLRKYKVDKGYHGRAFIIALISMIGVPFRIYEKLVYDKKAENVELEEAPIFILGHWRSGTTHLHNLLCEDDEAAYVTTYQSVFPDQTLTSGARFLFKNIMKMVMPLKRKGDNIKLSIDYPQEEEFTLGARNPASFYYYWYFPELIKEFYDEYLTFKTSSVSAKQTFIDDYKRVVNKAVLSTGKKRFFSKNPVNTGRISLLLEMYPNAKFIHIHRNPVDVILSTRHFYSKMMPGLSLHKVDYTKVNEDIYSIYERMMKDYQDSKSLIPKENLIEIKYEELTAQTMDEMRRIYDQFGFDGFENAAPVIERYAESKKGYVKNKYAIPRPHLDEILQHVDFAMKEWDYQVPDNIEIID